MKIFNFKIPPIITFSLLLSSFFRQISIKQLAAQGDNRYDLNGDKKVNVDDLKI